MWLLGVDLGWTTGASGVCALEQTAKGQLRFHEWDTLPHHAVVLDWITEYLAAKVPITLAIDAPLVIKNQTGSRPVDKEMQRLFAEKHAGVYPANQQQDFYLPMMAFVARLMELGFVHAAPIAEKPRYEMLEVYPHATTVRLFNLKKILKYKKGTKRERLQELEWLYQLQCSHFDALKPTLSVPPMPDTGTTLKTLKTAEDKLDALTCAYTAAWWAEHRQQYNQYVGALDTGYLVVPCLDRYQ
ncbi:MAG: DUF429 domain-containing protein [Thalassospira sp.]|jgi:predicted RNase H-like nuclease|nr:DUF429 domain-containing protein [Thalassospira sp.]